MEITRSQPFPLVASVSELSPETDYVCVIYDDHFQTLDVLETASNDDGDLQITLPTYFQKYDDEYRLEIYEKAGEDLNSDPILGDLIFIDTMTIMRPYVDAKLLAETEEKLKMCGDKEILDACLLAAIQEINHIKVSQYGTAAAFSRALQNEKAASLFHYFEVNEKKIDKKLNKVAKRDVNSRAIAPVGIE